MPTITVAGRDYDLIDTGEAWIIQPPHDLLDRITQAIMDAYRVQSEIAAEHNRAMPAGLARVTVDVIATELPALAGAGITSLTDAVVLAPHAGEWAGTTAADVARELGLALENVKHWVVAALQRLAEDRAAMAEDLLVRAADGATARAALKRDAHALVPAVYSEAELARRARVDRMTVRGWLGKR